MPKAGQILFHKQFVYSDGTTGEKLLVVLNTCENKDTCLILKTTSKSKWYGYATPGCNSSKRMFCVSKNCEQGFSKDTFVQMNQIYPVNIEDLLRENKITFVDRLGDICFNNLKRCLRNYKDDIPQQYWTAIYSAK